MELPKEYNAKESEPKWQEFWEREKIYKFDPKSKKKVYSIDVPPPYASAGHLHVGHALSYTQFEIMARYKRMAGYNIYFAPCFDNNGLPTEKYVEEKYNISKKDTTKAEFRKLCMEESRKVEKVYADRVFKKLGHSYDWDLIYTTIDLEAQKVAQRSFVELYSQGDAYRAEGPTLWCTKHQTALAQAEIEDSQRSTTLNYVDFNLEDGGVINIATTRPEFLPACVGIFVHPEDKRYTQLVGRKAVVPIFGYKVPIMKDEKVDMNFGSGIVMVCTFGDKADIEWWKKHNLPLKICITKDGKINKLGGNYEGKTIKEAQAEIIADLDAQGKLTKQETIQQNVGGCWRCNTPIEFIVTNQWFIKILKYKDDLIKQGQKINWYPEFYRKRYEDWTANLSWDWCISRQRFFGVPIPVWYCKVCGEPIMPGVESLPIDPEVDKPKKACKCGCKDFIPEGDVFDTWMTSSMSPQVSLRWLEKPEQFKKLFPLTLRPQSHDIIRTWAFYTILKSFLHFKKIPWEDIAINTFVLDPKGRAMHKSKGNAVWVDELMEKYNVDVVRYWIGTAAWGTDLPFKEQDLVRGSKFLIKLWNASKFAITNLEKFDGKKPKKLEAFDKWMIIKLNDMLKTATENYEKYNSSVSLKAAEDYFWHTLCDNYLEIIKDRIYNPNKRGEDPKKSAQYALYKSILTILKVTAPIMPHITEEIYSLYFKDIEKEKSLHISKWPEEEKIEDKDAEKAGDVAIEVISKVRQFKAENKLSLKVPVKLTLPKENQKYFEMVLDDLKSSISATEVKFGSELKIEL